MSTVFQTPQDVVRLASTPSRRRMLWPFTAGGQSIAPAEGYGAFVVSKGIDGVNQIQRADPSNLCGGEQVHVYKRSGPMELPFARVVKDTSGNAWDLTLLGTWAISDPRQFLNGYALSAVSAGAPLSRQMVESWMANAIADRVRDAARGQTAQDLVENGALPARWWEKRLAEWLGSFGLEFKLTQAKWSSADAVRAQAEARRQEDLANLDRQQSAERQAELRKLAREHQYEAEKVKLESDRRLGEAQRSHELELLERKHRTELLAAEKEIEDLARNRERAILEHEVQMAKLRNDAATASTAQRRQAESDARYEKIMAQLAAGQDALAKLTKITEPLLQKLAARDFQTAERLTSPEFSLSPAALAAMGFSMTPQALVDVLKRKQKISPPVQLQKEEFRTRDIGVAKVKALPIGSSLAFRFTPPRVGYATVINIGTSGNVWLQCPSAFRNGTDVVVQPGSSYMIPGDQLFPWEGDYREEGPAGWEHIAVIVSDDALIDPVTVRRSTTEMPLVAMTIEEIDTLVNKLNELPTESWSSAVVSFLVG